MRYRHTDDQNGTGEIAAMSYGDTEPRKVKTLISAENAVPALPSRRAAKRAFDIVAAITGLILFSPTFLLVSLAIKIDSGGPVFRRETKYDCNGAEFVAFKFRFNEITRNARDSSSMTRVGRVLSGSGIDGLPQLVNVLLGEMSFVGSRPHTSAKSEMFKGLLFFFRRPRL
jgi:lipopolysaccharide/colanic/teichoic acid biosynthesis glycosyltransferase